jgi:hypothetical protein
MDEVLLPYLQATSESEKQWIFGVRTVISRANRSFQSIPSRTISAAVPDKNTSNTQASTARSSLPAFLFHQDIDILE